MQEMGPACVKIYSRRLTCSKTGPHEDQYQQPSSAGQLQYVGHVHQLLAVLKVDLLKDLVIRHQRVTYHYLLQLEWW